MAANFQGIVSVLSRALGSCSGSGFLFGKVRGRWLAVPGGQETEKETGPKDLDTVFTVPGITGQARTGPGRW